MEREAARARASASSEAYKLAERAYRLEFKEGAGEKDFARADELLKRGEDVVDEFNTRQAQRYGELHPDKRAELKWKDVMTRAKARVRGVEREENREPADMRRFSPASRLSR